MAGAGTRSWVVGVAVVAVIAAGFAGLWLVTADDEHPPPVGEVVEVPGGEATKGVIGDPCPPSTRRDARRAAAALDAEYTQAYGDGDGAPFQEARVTDRRDIDDLDRAFVVLGVVESGEDEVEKVGCFRDVQVVWAPAGVLPGT